MGGYRAYLSIRGNVLYVIVLSRAGIQYRLFRLLAYLISRNCVFFIRTLSRKGLYSTASRTMVACSNGTILRELVPRVLMSFGISVCLLQVVGSR